MKDFISNNTLFKNMEPYVLTRFKISLLLFMGIMILLNYISFNLYLYEKVKILNLNILLK